MLIEITATAETLTPQIITTKPRGSFGDDKISFNFSSDWDSRNIVVTFHPVRGRPVKVPYLGLPIDIPAEVTRSDGKCRYVISGTIVSKDRSEVTSKLVSLVGYISVPFTISDEGGNTSKVTPDTYDKFLDEAKGYIEKTLQDAKDSGEFDGPPGRPGGDGAPGQQGRPGNDGEPGRDGKDGKNAEIKGATADIDETSGKPRVFVTAGGTPTERTFNFSFSGLKGMDGGIGPTGHKGERGDSGVFVGKGTPPPGTKIQIDPDGEETDASDISAVVPEGLNAEPNVQAVLEAINKKPEIKYNKEQKDFSIGDSRLSNSLYWNFKDGLPKDNGFVDESSPNSVNMQEGGLLISTGAVIKPQLSKSKKCVFNVEFIIKKFGGYYDHGLRFDISDGEKGVMIACYNGSLIDANGPNNNLKITNISADVSYKIKIVFSESGAVVTLNGENPYNARYSSFSVKENGVYQTSGGTALITSISWDFDNGDVPEIKRINGANVVDDLARKTKLDKNQGIKNAGKIMATNDKGEIYPADSFDVIPPGGGGVTDHADLTGREKPDQHPMSAITGLKNALEGKQPKGDYITQEADPTVPEWAKQPKKPTYTAAEVGALPKETKIPDVPEWALTPQKPTYKADEVGAVVPEGLTAEANVQSVLEALNAKPGGGGEGSSGWILLREETLSEPVSQISISVDSAGKPFKVSKVFIEAEFIGGETLSGVAINTSTDTMKYGLDFAGFDKVIAIGKKNWISCALTFAPHSIFGKMNYNQYNSGMNREPVKFAQTNCFASDQTGSTPGGDGMAHAITLAYWVKGQTDLIGVGSKFRFWGYTE